MEKINPNLGLSSLLLHAVEDDNPHNVNVTPIYQNSTYRIPDVKTGAAIIERDVPGYIYSRLSNPNSDQVANKIAILEGLDLLKANPDKSYEELIGARLYSSGMAAIMAAILSRANKSGMKIIAQEALYSNTFTFLKNTFPQYGVETIFLSDLSLESWEKAFKDHPDATLAYLETPSNPSLNLVDIEGVTEIAHRHNAWVMADNTFSTPFCQRPITLGADIIIHSTTKYLNGHGLIIGGALVTPHLDYLNGPLYDISNTLGGNPSPFDCWLLNNGLKTFELRIERQCSSAFQVARFLETHPMVDFVNYPGLESHPQHELAKKQMNQYGGMISFELKGGLKAGETMMNKVGLCRLAVSLGHIDTLIEHPATLTHYKVERDIRYQMGISDGLVRLSIGIENVQDIIADLDQALG
ncbi:MAG: aminotransferase class I/II-fold pyridoxal phosphate-dependent enzyme [Anaerolineaceae bacterium]|nr:aminotransferase class I/II-fold pyridoxal phosphate-dependent enzyme [Anaerolineaceae bacterium]